VDTPSAYEEPQGCTTETLATAVWEPFRDAWLVARTRFALVAGLGLGACDVHVEAYRGTVVLAGDVATSDASAAAERMARDVPGVVGVSNRLHVREVPCTRTCTDAEVRVAVTAELRRARALRGSIVVVESVYDGIVRLTGVARDPAASGTVFALAAAVPGVRRVINDVTIAPDAADGETDADAA
jgi:hyperosmotically inducible protein